jgi:Na+-translocating ferredoxin:NAD+ oxidoreductase RnfD subunit
MDRAGYPKPCAGTKTHARFAVYWIGPHNPPRVTGSPATDPTTEAPTAASKRRLEARAPGAVRPDLRHGQDLWRFYAVQVLGASFPAAAGVLLFGWRALGMLAVILTTAAAVTVVWRNIGARGRQLHIPHVLWLATLLWLMLPAHLLAGASRTGMRFDPWPIPMAGAILLVVLTWLLGGVGSGRIHPVIATFLLLTVMFDAMLAPSSVLQRHRVFFGDVLNAERPHTPAYAKEGYLGAGRVPGAEALRLDATAGKLLVFTSGQQRPGRSWLSLESLLRDELPPLEDLIIGGHPGAIGATCAIAIIIGGLFLLYRGVIDFRVPLCVLIGAYLALLTLPIPLVIKESGPQWMWLAWRDAVNVGPAKALTFANYEVMAGPMLLMTFFLATSPSLRPMARRARVIYGFLIGVLAAGLQLYVSISYGPYLALLIVSLLTPGLDRVFRQRPLV